MNDPKRWLDDPDFVERTHIDLGKALREEAGLPSLPALKSQVLGAIAAGIVPAAIGGAKLASLPFIGGLTLLTFVLGSGFGWMLHREVTEKEEEEVAVVQTEPMQKKAQNAGMQTSQIERPVPPLGREKTVLEPRVPPVVKPQLKRPVNGSPSPKSPKTRAKRKKIENAPTANASTLATQMQRYERAENASKNRHFATAKKLFEDAMKRAPRGILYTESFLGLVEAERELKLHAQIEKRTRSALLDPRFKSHLPLLQRYLLTALIEQGKCPKIAHLKSIRRAEIQEKLLQCEGF